MWSSPCHLVFFPCAVYLLKLLGDGAGLLRPGPISAAASTCGWDQQTEPLPRWMYIVSVQQATLFPSQDLRS